MRGLGRQLGLNDANIERQTLAKALSYACASIGAIISKERNTNQLRRNWLPQTIALTRAKASKQAGRRSSSSLTGMATTKLVWEAR
jgi:hypothetical protein